MILMGIKNVNVAWFTRSIKFGWQTFIIKKEHAVAGIVLVFPELVQERLNMRILLDIFMWQLSTNYVQLWVQSFAIQSMKFIMNFPKLCNIW